MHALREVKVPNAHPDAPKPRAVAGAASSCAALAKLDAALKAAPRVRKDTIRAVDVLVTASHDIADWPVVKQNDYFKRALDFISDKFGGKENILTAAVHRDETTPHLQVLIMPREPQTGRFKAVQMIGGPAGLRKLQDDFYKEVSKHFGLLRGDRGSNAEHVPIKRFYAQIATADALLPDFVDVPSPPTWSEKLTRKSKEIEKQREAAKVHNRRVRKLLLDRARAAAQIHPTQIARAADKYRAAVAIENLAKKERDIADSVVKKARAEFDRVSKEIDQLKATKTALENAVETVERGWHISTIDAFSATVEPEYRAYLAKVLGIELKNGKLIDQIRRSLKLSSTEAVEVIERASRARGVSFIESAGAWAARQEYSQAGDEDERSRS